MKQIAISTEYITLGQFLKFAGIIESGAMAKVFLSENMCIVNEEDENRRGRKLYDGYTVVVLGKKYQIVRG